MCIKFVRRFQAGGDKRVASAKLMGFVMWGLALNQSKMVAPQSLLDALKWPYRAVRPGTDAHKSLLSTLKFFHSRTVANHRDADEQRGGSFLPQARCPSPARRESGTDQDRPCLVRFRGSRSIARAKILTLDSIKDALRVYFQPIKNDDSVIDFYTMYKRETTEYDQEYMNKYNEDLNTTLIFVSFGGPLTCIRSNDGLLRLVYSLLSALPLSSPSNQASSKLPAIGLKHTSEPFSSASTHPSLQTSTSLPLRRGMVLPRSSSQR